MMKFDLRMARAAFFDRAAVQRAVDRGKQRALSKCGAFVRTTARGLIRQRPGISRWGQPPHTHGQRLLKRFILFAFDRASDSVVIGPVKLAKPGQATHALEFGGPSVRLKRGRLGRVRRQRITIHRRPYMAPALARNLRQIPEAFRASVSG
ncbi:MAG: hypothetical protein HRF50_04530 [Phycisphaerae bacterium]|jgi:hypothetical protein